MSVPLAYVGIVLIWSTTPLAIKWSGEEVGFLFGVSSRMLIGAAVSSLLLLALTRRLSWTRAARRTYVAAGLGVYGAMFSVYWGSQFIPSGLISVLFGLTPIVTGIMAALWLQERGLTPLRLAGIGLSLLGLAVIFGSGLQLGEQAGYGIGAVLLAVVLHSASSVWVKVINARLPALESTCGGLLVAAPLYLLSWLLLDGQLPETIPGRALASILYLAVIGSVLGFVMYFYVLKHIEASRVALVTLLTPVTALLLGQMLNQERISPVVWLGTCCILVGMSLYQWGPNMWRRLQARRAGN
jgi:drug/metabolite transporter (DMT)-like permease